MYLSEFLNEFNIGYKLNIDPVSHAKSIILIDQNISHIDPGFMVDDLVFDFDRDGISNMVSLLKDIGALDDISFNSKISYYLDRPDKLDLDEGYYDDVKSLHKIMKYLVDLSNESDNYTWFIEVEDFEDKFSYKDLKDFISDIKTIENDSGIDLKNIVEVNEDLISCKTLSDPVIIAYGSFRRLFPSHLTKEELTSLELSHDRSRYLNSKDKTIEKEDVFIQNESKLPEKAQKLSLKQKLRM